MHLSVATSPIKHATRALEEGDAQQSVEFAMQRAKELETYLNRLVHHPVCYSSAVLRLFLSLNDDLGTAWPEVSTNAIRRFSASLGNTTSKVVNGIDGADSTNVFAQLTGSGGGVAPGGGMVSGDYGEDDAMLLALRTTEQVRMGAIIQALPKLEGAVNLLRDQVEQSVVLGFELDRLASKVADLDADLGQPCQIMSKAIIKSFKPAKRLAFEELPAALHCFSYQYQLCPYERAAFDDRREAIARRVNERERADARARHLLLRQQGQSAPGIDSRYYDEDTLLREASLTDQIAVDASRDCDKIGQRLKDEVNRIVYTRRIESNDALAVVATSMMQATRDQLAVWEEARETFLTAFPAVNNHEPNAESNVLPSNGVSDSINTPVNRVSQVQEINQVPMSNNAQLLTMTT